MEKGLLLLVLEFSLMTALAFAQSQRRTAEDIFKESYEAQMNKQLGPSTADLRANAYREQYELCDSDHNCSDPTSKGTRKTVITKTVLPVSLLQ